MTKALQYVFGKLRRTTSTDFFLPEVDGLRFFAILVVLLDHTRIFVVEDRSLLQAQSRFDWIVARLLDGHKGVYLFFIISGFILGLPFARQHIKKEKPVNLKYYFYRRLTRLEPPYIFVICAITGVQLLRGYTFGEMLPPAAASLLYVHNFAPGGIWVNGVTWSLEIEVQFYLLAPLLAGVFVLPPRERRLVLATMIGLLPLLQHAYKPPFLSLYNYLQYFLAGFLLADLYLTGVKTNWPARFSLTAGLMLAAGAAFLDVHRDAWQQLLLCFCLFSCCLLVLTDKRWGRALGWPVLTVIGGMCYTIYLWHDYVIVAVIDHTMRWRIPGHFWPTLLLQYALILPCIVAVCSVLYLLIEKPCMDRHWPVRLANFFGQKLGMPAVVTKPGRET